MQIKRKTILKLAKKKKSLRDNSIKQRMNHISGGGGRMHIMEMGNKHREQDGA